MPLSRKQITRYLYLNFYNQIKSRVCVNRGFLLPSLFPISKRLDVWIARCITVILLEYMALVCDFIQTNNPQSVATLVNKSGLHVSYSLDLEVSVLMGRKVWEVRGCAQLSFVTNMLSFFDQWVSNTDAHWNHGDPLKCRFWWILRCSQSFCISNKIPGHWCCVLGNMLNAKASDYVPSTQELRTSCPNVFETFQNTTGPLLWFAHCQINRQLSLGVRMQSWHMMWDIHTHKQRHLLLSLWGKVSRQGPGVSSMCIIMLSEEFKVIQEH